MNYIEDIGRRYRKISALNTIAEFRDSANADVIEWFQCNESSSIGHNTNILSASNNELKHEYNGNDDISQRSEVSEALEIESRW